MRRGQSKATVHAAAIDMNRARSALTVVATFLRASEAKHFAQAIEQGHARIDQDLTLLTIHFQRDGRPAVAGIVARYSVLSEICHGLKASMAWHDRGVNAVPLTTNMAW